LKTGKNVSLAYFDIHFASSVVLGDTAVGSMIIHSHQNQGLLLKLIHLRLVFS
jgi:hypothetical protein